MESSAAQRRDRGNVVRQSGKKKSREMVTKEKADGKDSFTVAVSACPRDAILAVSVSRVTDRCL